MHHPAKKARKNQTRACVACKSRHQKCLGGPPCAFCVHKRINCEFKLQAKRGPKNIDQQSRREEEEAEGAVVEHAEVPLVVSGML